MTRLKRRGRRDRSAGFLTALLIRREQKLGALRLAVRHKPSETFDTILADDADTGELPELRVEERESLLASRIPGKKQFLI